jgi:glucokinase
MKLAIGVDLGGTNLRAALVQENGEVLQLLREKTPVKEGPKATAHLIARMSLELNRLAGSKAVVGIGLGSPGPLARREKKILQTPNLPGFDGFPMGEEIEREAQLEVFLDNDAKCAAFGEGYFGQAKNVKDFVFLTFGTGVGGGVISSGQMIYGKSDAACELGHVTLYPNGLPCKCGNHGCIEQYVSASAIKERATLAAGSVKNSVDLLESQKRGEAWAIKTLHEVVVDISIACASFVNVFDPSMIVFGGGVFATGGGPICEMVRDEIKNRCFKSSQMGLKIVPSSLGGNSGVLGAASLVFKDLNL